MARARRTKAIEATTSSAVPTGLTVRRVALDELVLDERNARVHGDRNRLAIRASLEAHGQVEPLVVQAGTRKVIGGNGRLVEMRGLGWTHGDVVELDVDDATATRLGVTLNRTAELAEWDRETLAELLVDVTADAEWTTDELRALVDAVGASVESGGERGVPAPGVDVVDLFAPFPWFGGKSRAASQVWAALGDVDNYVEPFAGSLGAMLRRPHEPRIETVNDADGLLCNWWRAVRAAPEEVAEWADWPVSEADLTARHLWLVERREKITRGLVDPEWYDAQAAGWWVWGACCWIGSGWCSGDGPWTAATLRGEEDGNAGQGVHRKLPHLGDAGRGVHRQLPHLGNAGQGVHRQLPHLGDAGQGVQEWFAVLAARLRRVRIACGDWTRVVTPSVCERHGLTGVLLDPPYPEGWDADGAYAGQTHAAAEICRDVFAAAIDLSARGCRVVVCGYDGTWTPPAGWTTRPWTARKGYATHDAHHGEVLWCSPLCENARVAESTDP